MASLILNTLPVNTLTNTHTLSTNQLQPVQVEIITESIHQNVNTCSIDVQNCALNFEIFT